MSEFFIPQPVKKDLWYKEPWMYLVIGGPLLVIIAGFITLYLAMHGADKVVASDYYKQGLNINKTIAQDAKAAALHLQGNLQFQPQDNRLGLKLAGDGPLPETLQMTISTNYRAGEVESQQKITLKKTSSSQYEGVLNTTIPANVEIWHVKIETAEWRLTGDWVNPYRKAMTLNPAN